MLNQRRILSKIVQPACLPGARPGNYIAYREAFPSALAKDSSSRWTYDLALQTTDSLTKLSIPVRAQNVLLHPSERSTMWIKMVARIMAIGPGEWNGRERERSNDVHLVILGPLALLPMKPNVQRIMRGKTATHVEPNMPHHTVMLQAGVDWATLESTDYILNRDSFGLEVQQRKIGFALHRALERARLRTTPYFGRDNFSLVRVKRHFLTSAVIVHRAQLFPKIPRFSWILYSDSHSGSDKHGVLHWGLVHDIRQTASGRIYELVISTRRNVEASGADRGALTNLVEGMRPSDKRTPKQRDIAIYDVRALVDARQAAAGNYRYRHIDQLGLPDTTPFPALRQWDYIVYRRSDRSLASAWYWKRDTSRRAHDSIVILPDKAEVDTPDDRNKGHHLRDYSAEAKCISRHDIVDQVELASANFDNLSPGVVVFVVVRTGKWRYIVCQATIASGVEERASSFRAWLPGRSRKLRSQIGNHVYLDTNLPSRWYSRRNIFIFREDALFRRRRSKGRLTEQFWCEHLLSAKKLHGTKSSSRSRSSSPGSNPSSASGSALESAGAPRSHRSGLSHEQVHTDGGVPQEPATFDSNANRHSSSLRTSQPPSAVSDTRRSSVSARTGANGSQRVSPSRTGTRDPTGNVATAAHAVPTPQGLPQTTRVSPAAPEQEQGPEQPKKRTKQSKAKPSKQPNQLEQQVPPPPAFPSEPQHSNPIGQTGDWPVEQQGTAETAPRAPVHSGAPSSQTRRPSLTQSTSRAPSSNADSVPIDWIRKRKTVGYGLPNLGNTCYINSILQVLLHTGGLVEYLMDKKYHYWKTCEVGNEGGFCLICTLSELALDFHGRWDDRGDMSSIRRELTSIRDNIGGIHKSLRKGRQEDAHEFFIGMLDRISQEQGRTPTVETLFQGTTRTVTVCNACQHHSKTEETPFRSLDVSVQTHSSVAAAFREAYGKPSGILNDYHCERCGDRWSSTSERIARAPQILCIQLQRFKSRGEGKCEDHIKVDQFLHIDDASTRGDYRLYGVTSHSGTLQSGHYVAAVCAPDGAWYRFDDEVETPIYLSDVISERSRFTPYLLFYQRVSARPIRKSQNAAHRVSAMHRSPPGAQNGP